MMTTWGQKQANFVKTYMAKILAKFARDYKLVENFA